MDYLGKEEMLTKMDVNKFVHKIRESLGSFILAHETFDELFTCCVYIFVQCNLMGLVPNLPYTKQWGRAPPHRGG